MIINWPDCVAQLQYRCSGSRHHLHTGADTFPRALVCIFIMRPLADIRATLVFYETGPRLGDALEAMRDVLGNREGAVVREISKLYEESVTGSLAELAELYAGNQPKGEIVVVVGPPEQAEASDDDLDRALTDAMRDASPSRAAAEVATRLKIPRKRAYARALELSR